MFISPKAQKLSPLLKYPGGKDKELIHILPNIPTRAQNYYEPFVGGENREKARVRDDRLFQLLCGIFLFNPHFDRAIPSNFSVGFLF